MSDQFHPGDPSDSDHVRKHLRRTINRDVNTSETIEEYDVETGRLAKRTVRSQLDRSHVTEDKTTESASAARRRRLVQQLAAGWQNLVPRQLQVSVFEATDRVVPELQDFAGDYIVSLVSRSPDAVRWECRFPKQRQLSQLSLTAKPSGGRLAVTAAFEGGIRGPSWIGVAEALLARPFTLHRDRNVPPSALADADWPLSLYVTPLQTSAGQQQPFYISPEPTAAERAAMAAFADSSSSSCGCEIESVSADTELVCVGTMISFEAEVNNPCEEDETWSAPGGDPDEGNGTSFATKWGTPGTKTVTFICGDDSDSVNVTVVAVGRVIIDGSDPENEGPARICVGSSLTLRTIPTPQGASFPGGSPAWEITTKPDGSQISNPPSGSDTAEITPDVPGAYQVQASCGTSSKTFTINAVGVEKVIVDGSNPEDEGPTIICYNDSITLRAKPSPADASFPSGSPTWEITVKPIGSQIPNPPSGNATAEIDPDQPGTYEIKASCGSSSKAFTLHAVKVQITSDTGVPLTTPQTAIVGQKISLKRTVVPEITPGDELWEIDGSVIKNYTQSRSEAKVHLLQISDLMGSDIEFYWIKGETSVDVKYTAYFGDVQCSNTITCEVKRPVATLESTITPLVPPTGIRSLGTIMQFGNPAVPETQGIIWNASVTTQVGGGGEIAFLQLVNTVRTGTLLNDTVVQISSDGAFVLDSGGGAIQYDIVVPIGSNETKEHESGDSPLNGALHLRKKTAANDSFRLFLVYRPTGGIWVTLRRLDWYWTASATSTTGDGSNWAMGPGQLPANDNNPPGSSDSTYIPEWNGYAQGIAPEITPP